MKRKRNIKRLLTSCILLLIYILLHLKGKICIQSPYEGTRFEASESVGILEVHYINVGQGDCTFLTCDGQTMLIDCGDFSQGTAIQNYLIKQGVEKIDYLILTHPDADHIGGAPVIITKFDIGRIFMSGYEKENRTYERLLESMKYKYYFWETPVASDTVNLGSAEVVFVGPVDEYEDPNNSSLSFIVYNGNTSFLFSGDAESQAEYDMVLSQADLCADVYKVGHHGSNTSSSTAFLSAIKPEYAVISCGAENEYGHPHSDVLEALELMGAETFRTDTQGTIIAVSDGERIRWNQELQGMGRE